MTAPQDQPSNRPPDRVTSSLWVYRTGEWIWMGLAAVGVVALVLWSH
jgi:hypothetical protein